jgi:hypothetical protein
MASPEKYVPTPAIELPEPEAANDPVTIVNCGPAGGVVHTNHGSHASVVSNFERQNEMRDHVEFTRWVQEREDQKQRAMALHQTAAQNAQQAASLIAELKAMAAHPTADPMAKTLARLLGLI